MCLSVGNPTRWFHPTRAKPPAPLAAAAAAARDCPRSWRMLGEETTRRGPAPVCLTRALPAPPLPWTGRASG
jgi:hypothetical protein